MYPTGLTEDEIRAYGCGRDGYYHLWGIGAVVKYEEPIPLTVFGMERPPQSWCYVEERA